MLTVHADGRPDIFIHGTKKYTDDELLEIFKDDNNPVFVFADENDKAIGHAFCEIQETKGQTNVKDMKTIYIDDICVDEDHRRKHIASDLYNYVINYAREIGCYHVTLNVWESNPGAKKFYESMGMKTLKTMMETIL